MFGTKKKVVAERVVTYPPPVGRTLEAELADEERNTYTALAQELGFRPAALVKEELLALLKEQGVKVYLYEDVRRYLQQMLGKKGDRYWGHIWGWRALREQDRERSTLPDRNHDLDNGEFAWSSLGYQGAIPLPVLHLVGTISKAIPDVGFFVSDVQSEADRFKDPFLAATVAGLEELIIIACWDEPSFKG